MDKFYDEFENVAFRATQFEGYEIGEDGTLISFIKTGPSKELNEKFKVLKPQVDKGYLVVDIAGKRCVPISRLVCSAFHSKVEGKPLVLHNDGNSFNNHKDNLRWGDNKDNSADTLKHGTQWKPKKFAECKLTADDVMWIRDQYHNNNVSIRSMAIKFGVARITIADAAKGRSWRWL